MSVTNEQPPTETVLKSQEEVDELVIRAAEDYRFYREGLADLNAKRDTDAALGCLTLNKLRVFVED